MKIVVPLKPESWNVLVRKNHWIVTAFKDEWHEAVNWEIKRQNIKPVTEYPVTLHVEAHWKHKRRHDIDSLCTKFAIDALVKAGILVDDDLTHVERVIFTGKTGQTLDQLVIEIKNTP